MTNKAMLADCGLTTTVASLTNTNMTSKGHNKPMNTQRFTLRYHLSNLILYVETN